MRGRGYGANESRLEENKHTTRKEKESISSRFTLLEF